MLSFENPCVCRLFYIFIFKKCSLTSFYPSPQTIQTFITLKRQGVFSIASALVPYKAGVVCSLTIHCLTHPPSKMCSRLAKLNEAYVNLHRIRQNLIPKPEEIENVRMLQVTEDLIEELFREEIQKDKEEWTEKYRLQKQQREQREQQPQQQEPDRSFVDCRVDTKEFSFSFRRSRPYSVARRGRNLRR